jgi:hypothetical protein
VRVGRDFLIEQAVGVGRDQRWVGECAVVAQRPVADLFAGVVVARVASERVGMGRQFGVQHQDVVTVTVGSEATVGIAGDVRVDRRRVQAGDQRSEQLRDLSRQRRAGIERCQQPAGIEEPIPTDRVNRGMRRGCPGQR